MSPRTRRAALALIASGGALLVSETAGVTNLQADRVAVVDVVDDSGGLLGASLADSPFMTHGDASAVRNDLATFTNNQNESVSVTVTDTTSNSEVSLVNTSFSLASGASDTTQVDLGADTGYDSSLVGSDVTFDVTASATSATVDPMSRALTVEDSLHAYYSLESDSPVPDKSGNGYDATNNGASTGASGKVGNAFSFTATNSEDVDAGAMGNPFASSTFAISAWVNSDLSGKYTVFSAHDSASDNKSLYLRIGTGTLIIDEGIRFSFYNNTLQTDSSIMSSNTWHHIVAQYDNDSGDREIYLDGTLEASDNTSAYTGSSPDVRIGSWNSSDYLDGSVDDVRVYKRFLSSSEVSTLHQLTK